LAVIAAKSLRRVFRGGRGLHDFSLNVQSGELVGLVGPNGAGKSTLLKILATLQPIDSGQASIAAHDVGADPLGVRSVVGYLPDVPGIYQDMRVGEFLEFFADAFRLKEPRRSHAINAALERSGLVDRRDDFVEQLSLGWKQRLMLAKTLLHSPSLLLLDEPATGLDPLARIVLREQLKQLHAGGVTILVSSHILSDLEDICTRIVFIADGRNVAEPQQQVASVGATAITICELSFQGPLTTVETVAREQGAIVLAKQEARISVQLSGEAKEASAFLQRLLAAGITVLHFDARGPGLEERYRRAFSEHSP
jgi:ABC-2 type transport system ATP-binding protein